MADLGNTIIRGNLRVLGKIISASGSGSGGSTVSVTPTVTSGTQIASISVDGIFKTLYAPQFTAGIAACTTAESTTSKVATLSGYVATAGQMVAVRFTYNVPASSTLNINGQGAKPIFYRASAITAGIIKANDLVTFVYNGTQYNILSIDRDGDTSTLPTNLVNGSATGSLRTIGSRVESDTYTIGQNAFAEGKLTTASGDKSHAEGYNTLASADNSHSEGYETTALGNASHAEGGTVISYGSSSHAEGSSTLAYGHYSHAEGTSNRSTYKLTGDANAVKYTCSSSLMLVPIGACVIYNGTIRTVTAIDSSNRIVTLSGTLDSNNALSDTSVTIDVSPAFGAGSHREGYNALAYGNYSHAEGSAAKAYGNYSHAEGSSTKAQGSASHAEGYGTTASGYNSHAEGSYTTASGEDSHAEGISTIARGSYQHSQGKYNIEDTQNKYAHIVGNGTNSSKRSNAHTLDWNGNAWYKGDVYVGGTNQDTGSHKLIPDNQFIDYQLRDKNGILDQSNIMDYIKAKYDDTCSGVAQVLYYGQPGNDVMYAVHYYQHGYLSSDMIGIYKYHVPATDNIIWIDSDTRDSENGEITDVTTGTNSKVTISGVYTTNLTEVTVQYNGGGRWPEFYDVTTTYTISGTTITATCNGTDLSNYDSIRVKLKYSDETVVYTDEYATGGGPAACFTENTQVETENGFKSISEIKVGDKVYSYNFETEEIELKEVDKLINHKINQIINVYTDNEILETTWSHPFYVLFKNKVLARNLKVKDQLRMKNNMITKVNQLIISELKKEKTVYEIRVKDNNNYFVGNSGILVYNETSVL